MSKKEDLKIKRRAKRAGKSPASQAGDFVRETIHEVRKSELGARSAKQAIAIGLSRARRAGVDLPPPKRGKVSEETREKATRDYEKGQQEPTRKPAAKRSRAVRAALKREGSKGATHKALSRQAQTAASKMTAAERSERAKKAAAARTPEQRRQSALKAARTRARFR